MEVQDGKARGGRRESEVSKFYQHEMEGLVLYTFESRVLIKLELVISQRITHGGVRPGYSMRCDV